MKGRDCLAIAKTGSGKTCGYLLPGMTQILKNGNNYNNLLFKAIVAKYKLHKNGNILNR
jgi:superfamily II DNA/RNA helicase